MKDFTEGNEGNEEMSGEPRSVYVRLGVPEELRSSPDGPQVDEALMEEGANLDELWMIDFAEEGAELGFTAFAGCLHTLSEATEKWLMGGSEEDVRAVMEHKH